MRPFYLLLLLCTALAVAVEARPGTALIKYGYSSTFTDTSYRIIPVEASTYGYEILVNNKLLIRQKNIPGLPGNRGFASKADAAKTARLVIGKLQRGEMPPTITTRELDSLKIQLPHF